MLEDLHLVMVLGPRAAAPRERHSLSALDLENPALAFEADVTHDMTRHGETVANRERSEIHVADGDRLPRLPDSPAPIFFAFQFASRPFSYPFTHTICFRRATGWTRSEAFSMTSSIGL